MKIRFYQKVLMPDSNGCMRWTARKSHDGYGTFKVAGRQWMAHRMSYVLSVGPIPEGLELDHLCRVRDCVTPDHLEPVTHGENVRRSDSPYFNGSYFRNKTHCPRDHEYTPENTLIYYGRRNCRKCRNAYARDLYKRKKEANEPINALR